jgi:hypothetical protein
MNGIYLDSVMVPCHVVRCRDSSVGMISMLRAGRPRDHVSVPGRVGDFSLLTVQTGSGAHQASYIMDTGGYFPVVKAAGA